MTKDKAVRMLRNDSDGVQRWNALPADKKPDDLMDVDLSGAKLEGIVLSGFDLRRSKLIETVLTKAIIEDADLRNTDLTKARLTQAKMRGSDFRNATITAAHLDAANLVDTDFREANLTSSTLSHSKADRANCTGAILTNTSCCYTDLSRASLRRTNMRRANFEYAILDGADLTMVDWDTTTRLANAHADGCTVGRHTLELLDDYGGLTKGARMQMNIVDDVAKLRLSYSGFVQWIHLTSLAVFLFPYLFFLWKQWALARFQLRVASENVAVWQALLQFVASGGESWGHEWIVRPIPLILFIFSFGYNVLRGILLWQTKTLEARQEASGLPVIFSLTGRWGILYTVARWGFWMNLVVVAGHTFHFCTQRIPISP